MRNNIHMNFFTSKIKKTSKSPSIQLMYFLFPFIALAVYLRNPFSSKKYSVCRINWTIFIFRSNPEIVIHDYYFYVQNLLIQNLGKIKKRGLVFYECTGFKPLKLLIPSTNIFLQIEHTLFNPRNNVLSPGIPGGLKVPGHQKNYLVRIAEIEKLTNADIIFDYSRINLFNIRSAPKLKDYLRKSFCISPSLYPLSINSHGRNGVITLFGNPDLSRRKLFLEDLKKHRIISKNIRDVYFGIDKIYQKTKMVINIRQTDSYDTLEELRVLPALRNGAIVICETAPYAEKTAYSKFIIWGSLQELPRLVEDVEKNYEEVHARIFGDGAKDSPFIRRMRRIEKCNALAIKRVIQRMNVVNK